MLGHYLDDCLDRCFPMESLLVPPTEEGAQGEYIFVCGLSPNAHMYLPSPQLHFYPSIWPNCSYKKE